MKTISTQHNTDAIERKHPWPMVRLGDVCEVRAGANYRDVEDPNGRYPIYGTGGIMGRASQYRCPAHSVIVGRKGTLDNPYLVDEPFWNIDTCFGVVPSERIIPEYLFRFCQGFDFYSLVPASGRPSTTSDAVRAIEIPLPPLPVQREIVARLEREFAAVEKMKKGFEALAETAKAEFKAELKEVFESGELRVESGELAVRRVKLGEICETITDGDHQPPPKSSQGVPFLVISNVASGRISFENTRFVPRAYYEAIQENRKPRKGDVLLTVTGSYGIPVVVETDDMFCFQRHIALIRASRLDSKFLAYVLQSPESKRYFDLVATGAAQKTIGLGSIRAMSIPFPSMSAQRQIVDRLSAAKARTEKLEAKAREGVAVCETMRKAILKEAFE